MGDFTVKPHDLYNRIGRADSPVVFDVCRCDDYDAEQRLVPGSRWRDHQRVDEWFHEVPVGRRVVTVCVRGFKVSQAAAAELRLRGIDAAALEGGITGWKAAGLPTAGKRLGVGDRAGNPTRWVTRVRPKIDRIACPWLIARFLDPAAKFFYVNPDQVVLASQELKAIPFDVSDVEITHRGNETSFDALIADFGLRDPALDRVALVVRGADTARMEIAPEASGLLAISLGISALSGPEDHMALERGFAVYDALYAWAKFAAGETHNWPAAKV